MKACLLTRTLIRIFVRDNAGEKNEAAQTAVRGRYASLAGGTGIAANCLLFLIKLTVGLVSGSVAIIADAFNNISDAGSAIVTLLGFRMSARHEDSKHPLGHGRLEYISAFIVDILIILVGAELLGSSINKIINPELPQVSTAGLILLGAGILVKLWMYFFYRTISIRINSSAIRGASLDSISDVAASSVVLGSALVSRFAGVALDGWAGLLVAAFIIFTGVKAAKETIELLLGASPDPKLVAEIYDFVREYPDVIGIHDLMVHDYGPGRLIITLHAEVPEDTNLLAAHEVIDGIERDMKEHFGGVVTIHIDPMAVGNQRVGEMRAMAEQCALEIDPAFSIHDFRMTAGENLVNLVFDLCIPTDSKYSDDEAAALVAARISEKQPQCRVFIQAEHPFV
ncbi:MAG: cation transporter [Ruminococcaceae bacterium]|nr:cation transporter [Oscillospiraceae bacterium]